MHFQPRATINFRGLYPPLGAYLFGLIGGGAGKDLHSFSIWAATLCVFAKVVLQAPIRFDSNGAVHNSGGWHHMPFN